MVNLPIQVFNLKDYDGNFIKLTLNEIYGFPDELSYGGGYGANGLMEIEIGGYSVNAHHNFTTGELHQFSCQLKEMYNSLSGKAYIDNVASEFEMSIVFDKYGRVEIEGEFQASQNNETKLIFEMSTDQTVIREAINDLENVYNFFGGHGGVEDLK